jgi:RimJ/RimL family protein N-acetyltransferase
MIMLELPKLDIGALKTQASWLNNKTTVRYSEQRHMIHTAITQLQYIRSFIEHPSNILREIRLDGNLIGTISAYIDKHNRIADVGILIGHGFQGKGYGYEAWSMFCKNLFENGDMRRIEGGCMANNLPMIKLFRKYGMKEEGRRMSHFVFEGSYSDLVLHGRFR